ncbi:MAG TPA: acyltransferase family protein [Acidimicrobiales bacterium]|nr:acyltransferase family protein [Acidimicrobiales bacterium]
MTLPIHPATRPSQPPATPAVDHGRPIEFGFVPALDGLRAVAVLGVMLYHGGAPLVTGGFLGIDVFFVLSGFLITSLLLGEWAERLTIKLGQFWARRARRLLPALLVMLVGVAVYARVFATPGAFANLRLDSLSTLFYVANWHFIFGGGSYFNLAAQPSPLQHMWSLSIEEQFYIVWPPVALVMLHLGRRLRPSRRLWPILAVSVVGAVASAVDMRLSYQGGASVMRLYEGTDTRAQDILVGAALAVGMAIWAERRPRSVLASDDAATTRPERSHPSAGTTGQFPPRPHRRDPRRRLGPRIKPITAWELRDRSTRTLLQVLGWSAVAAGAYLWSHLSTPGAFLLDGGYFLFAFGVAVVIFCVVTAQGGSLSIALGNSVFRYIGKISYGAYLWHFPLFQLLNGERLHLQDYPLLILRIGATLAVATGSFYLVELPIRQRRIRSFTQWRAWLLSAGAFLGVVAVTVATTVPSAAEATSPVRFVGTQYAGPPVKVMIFGDSVAWRVGFAMLASQPQNSYDVSIDNGAIVGCGILRSTKYLGHGVPQTLTQQCNTSSPASQQWPAQWKGDLQQFRPNVVLVLAGRWEVSDRLIDGHWVHIGDPLFDAALRQSLEESVQVGTSTGALVVLLTSPCFSSGEQDNGQPWPEDSPVRLNAYNTMLRQVAAEHPATVRLDDFGAQVCPGGVYASSIHGVQIRDADGVHTVPTAAAGQWLDAVLLPEAISVGRLQMEGRQLTAPPSSTASSTTSSTSSPALSAAGRNRGVP